MRKTELKNLGKTLKNQNKSKSDTYSNHLPTPIQPTEENTMTQNTPQYPQSTLQLLRRAPHISQKHDKPTDTHPFQTGLIRKYVKITTPKEGESLKH